MSDAGSGRPQLAKLGLVPGARWSVVGAAAAWRFEVDLDPDDEATASGAADVVIAFARSRVELDTLLYEQETRIFPAGALWIAWPRRAAGHVSELGDDVVRAAGLARQLVDVKVAALDHDWSALKFVWRVQSR